MSSSHINTSNHTIIRESSSLSSKLSKWVTSIVAATILSGCADPHIHVIPRDNGVPQTYYKSIPKVVTPQSIQQEQEAIRQLKARQQMLWEIEQQQEVEEYARREYRRQEQERREYLRRKQEAHDNALRRQWEYEQQEKEKRYERDKHYRGNPIRWEYGEPHRTFPITPYNSIPKKRTPYDSRSLKSDRE